MKNPIGQCYTVKIKYKIKLDNATQKKLNGDLHILTLYILLQIPYLYGYVNRHTTKITSSTYSTKMRPTIPQ